MQKREVNWENIILLVWNLLKWGTLLAISAYLIWSVLEVGHHQLDWDYKVSPLNLFKLILKGE